MDLLDVIIDSFVQYSEVRFPFFVKRSPNLHLSLGPVKIRLSLFNELTTQAVASSQIEQG